MAQIYRWNTRQYLRLTAVLCFTALIVGAAGGALGATRVDLFQATVPVTDRSEAAQTAAFQAALRNVLVRVTGRRTADEDAAFAPLVSNARRYVQQFRSAADNQVWVAFDGSAIERWLTQNDQPLWGRDRPLTLVWLAVQSGPQTNVVLTTDDSSDLKMAIDAAAAARGIPIVWPSAAAASAGPAAQPADVAHRNGADGVLIGRASNASAAAQVRWTLQFQDRSSEFSGALDGVNHAADLYAEMFAANGALAPVDIEVSGITDLHDYAGIQTYLESLTFITHVGVQSLVGDIVRFRLTTRGGVQPLVHAASLSGKMQALPVGDNGLQRFQLRH